MFSFEAICAQMMQVFLGPVHHKGKQGYIFILFEKKKRMRTQNCILLRFEIIKHCFFTQSSTIIYPVKSTREIFDPIVIHSRPLGIKVQPQGRET